MFPLRYRRPIHRHRNVLAFRLLIGFQYFGAAPFYMAGLALTIRLIVLDS